MGVSLRLVYLIFNRLLSWLTLLGRAGRGSGDGGVAGKSRKVCAFRALLQDVGFYGSRSRLSPGVGAGKRTGF
jgi:hypothetical protein